MLKIGSYVVVANYAQAVIVDIQDDMATVKIIRGAQKCVPMAWLRAA